MTETTEEKEKAQQMAERYNSKDFKDLKIKSLEAQVTSLTKERDELKAEVDDLNYRAEEDERTIINHEKEMDALKSQLSNREKEIEELKEVLKKLSQVHIESIEPNYLCDNCATWTSGLLKAIEETEKLALASLNKEREE